MKRLLVFFAVLALALSCGKENGGNGSGAKEVESIKIESSSTIRLSIENAAGRLLPVTISPEGCTVNQVKLSIDKEGIIACNLSSEGVLVKPLSIGEAKLTLSPKEGPGSSAQVTVKVLSAEDYATLEISKIDIESTVTLRDKESVIVPVKLTPEEATTDMLKWSGGEGYVTVSAVEGGLKFEAKSVGNPSVKIEAKKGTAAAKTVEVEILDKNAYSEYVISDIKYSPSTVEVKDNGTTDITLTLTPGEATVTDLIVSSSNNTVAEVTKMGGKVLRITGKKAGSANITVKGLRLGSKEIKIPVTVYGHVTAVKIDDPDNYDLLKGGSGKYLSVTLSKTGDLKSQPEVKWSTDPENTDLIELSESGYVRGIKAGGSSVSVKVVASVEDCTSSVSFHVYDYATSVQVDAISGSGELESSAYNLKQGQSCNFKWRVLPATAKQEYSEITLKPSNNKVTVSTVKSGSDYKTTITAADGSATKELHELIIKPVNQKTSTVQVDKLFYFNQYYSSDVKPGDYVYYNSSDSRFYWSDGGVRCAVSSNNIRYISKSQQSGLGNFIGKVYNENVPTIDDAYNALSKKGFANNPVSGKHACVLSAKLAHKPGEDPDFWRFTESNEDIYDQNSWKNNRPYKVALQGGMDYSNKLNIRYFNYNSGSSWKIKPGDLVFDFDKVTFGTISDYSALSHTGWMLPMMTTAKDYINIYSKCFEDVFSGFSDFKRPYWDNNWGSQPYTEYWTGQQYSIEEAHIWTFNGVSQREKDPGEKDHNTHKPFVRPILWL